MPETDATLVLRTLKGDRTAFAELYNRYAPLVRAICRDTEHDFNKVQDLTQEAFLRAYVKLEELKDPNRFGKWVVSIARNVCRESRRQHQRDRHILVGIEPSAISEKPKGTQERLSHLSEAISKLPARERLALHCYYLQDRDVEQARKIVGTSRSGFFRLLNKAKKQLEKQLSATALYDEA